MDSSSVEPPPPDTPAACSENCRYAEPLRGDYAEWIWCARPGASVRVQRTGFDCVAFDSADAVQQPRFDPS